MTKVYIKETRPVDEWFMEASPWQIPNAIEPTQHRLIMGARRALTREIIIVYVVDRISQKVVSKPSTNDLKDQFDELVHIWKQERGPTSSVSQMAMHPSYQRIIGMGSEVIPFILDEMRREPDHWFWALRAITGQNPVRNEYRGNLPLMTHDWLEWAREQGF